MNDLLTCFARGHRGHWEAICLDLNIAAQGESFQEVKDFLERSIDTYVKYAMKEDAATREQLLRRRAPFFNPVDWTAGFAIANVLGHRGRRAGNIDESAAFAVPCHA